LWLDCDNGARDLRLAFLLGSLKRWPGAQTVQIRRDLGMISQMNRENV
jgi:hypothetical protein